MSSFPVTAFLRRALFMTAGAVLVACASSAGPKPATAVAGLYAQLDEASAAYESAVQQMAEANTDADTDTAQAALGSAMDKLQQASTKCLHTAGCDPQRFFEAFEHLLHVNGDGLAGTGADGVEAETVPSDAGVADGQAGAPLPAQAQRSVTLLRGQKLSELIAMNGPVKAALEMWLTQWRPALMDAYVNYEYLRTQMEPAYKQAQLPEALLFGIMAKESGGKVHAVSRSGAAGPLQFMYATGLRFGLNNQDGFDLRFDPAAAARANADYIDEQLKVFNNNLEITLAAYNAGEGRMRRMVGDDPSVSFYDPKIYNQLSPETRTYVPEVLAAAWLFLHPDSYNLHFPSVDDSLATVTLQRPASLTELTVCLGSAEGMDEGWFRTLRNLNPRLDPQAEQPAGSALRVPAILEKAYASRCVTGPWPILASDLHGATVALAGVTKAAADADARRVRSRAYRVRKGDTLIGIVNKLSCSSVKEVAQMNGIKNGHLRAGHTIKLPSC